MWHDGYLYETTGRAGQSQLRKVDLATGEVLAATDLPPDQFGEGLALWGDELIGLTWLNGTIHRWSLDTLEPIRSEPFGYRAGAWRRSETTSSNPMAARRSAFSTRKRMRCGARSR